MGFIKHNAMIVTGMGEEFERTHNQAKALFGQLVTEVVPSLNNYKSFFVATSGSKLGWEEQYKHEKKRKDLANFIDALREGDGSNMVQFVDVSYDEENEVLVERTNVSY